MTSEEYAREDNKCALELVAEYVSKGYRLEIYDSAVQLDHDTRSIIVSPRYTPVLANSPRRPGQ